MAIRHPYLVSENDKLGIPLGLQPLTEEPIYNSLHEIINESFFLKSSQELIIHSCIKMIKTVLGSFDYSCHCVATSKNSH